MSEKGENDSLFLEGSIVIDAAGQEGSIRVAGSGRQRGSVETQAMIPLPHQARAEVRFARVGDASFAVMLHNDK